MDRDFIAPPGTGAAHEVPECLTARICKLEHRDECGAPTFGRGMRWSLNAVAWIVGGIAVILGPFLLARDRIARWRRRGRWR